MVKSIRTSLFLIGPMFLLFLFNQIISCSGDAVPDESVSEFATETIDAFDNLNHLPVIEAAPPYRSVPTGRHRPNQVPNVVPAAKTERAGPWESGVELIDRLSHADNAVQQSSARASD